MDQMPGLAQANALWGITVRVAPESLSNAVRDFTAGLIQSAMAVPATLALQGDRV
jgi:hypothetical protein